MCAFAVTVVSTCLMCVLLVVLVLFPIVYISLFSYLWIPESQPIWVKAANSVYSLSHLFTDITSFPLYIVGRVWDQGPGCYTVVTDR